MYDSVIKVTGSDFGSGRRSVGIGAKSVLAFNRCSVVVDILMVDRSVIIVVAVVAASGQ